MRLHNKVSIIVPTKIGHEAIKGSTVNFYVDTILEKFSRLVGGASVTEQKGAWFSETIGLVKETNYLVYAYCTEADLKKLTRIARLMAYEMEAKLEQDSIMYEVNGEARFT